jgi:NADH:ubiquinone oxidoreductase subunit E
MSDDRKTITIVAAAPDRQRRRQAPKGRVLDPLAQAEVAALLGAAPRSRDLLIEHLHKLQDRFGHLAARHLAALAREMNLAQAEVFEVASFYHHFDIVKEGQTPPPPLTVRVCDGLSCELAGAHDLLASLPALLGREVRVIAAPCVGRCEQAPVAVVGQRALARASLATVGSAVADGTTRERPSNPMPLESYRASGGYRLLRRCLDGDLEVEAVLRTLESSGLRGLGGAGFPAGRKWRIVREQAAPRLMAVNIDEGEPGTSRTAGSSSATRTASSKAC